MSILDSSASGLNAVVDPIAAKIKNPFSNSVNNKGSRPQDFPDGFTITEYVDGLPLDGTGGRKNTVIKLVGTLMPMQPFQWETEQRLVKEYYPGNPEPAVQVMGYKDGPLSIHGRFKDKRYRDSSLYGVSFQLSKAVDEMLKRGNLVRFGMHGPAGDYIRYGYIEHSTFKMNKQSWIDYDITFFAMSQMQPKNNFFAAPDKSAPNAINQNLINAATAFNTNFSTAPTSMPQSLAGELNDIVSSIASNINVVTGFINTVITTAADVQAAANRAIGLIKNMRTLLYTYQLKIGMIVHGFTSLSTAAQASSKMKDTYTNLSYKANLHASIDGIAQYLAQLQAQFAAISQTIPIARYKVIAGDSLQRIAIRYYGTADNWKAIYDHNKLQTTVLVAGAVLEIPRA